MREELASTHSWLVLSPCPYILAQTDLGKGITGTLFGLSIITATTRTATRFQSQWLCLDDLMLIFACLMLIASQILLYMMMETIYYDEALLLNRNPQTLALAFEDPEAFYRRILRFRQISFSFLALNWTTVFAVKICFLLFFHRIITRLKRLALAWKVIFGITILF